MKNGPFKMKGWSPFAKTSPAKDKQTKMEEVNVPHKHPDPSDTLRKSNDTGEGPEDPIKMKGSPYKKSSPAKDHETDASGNVKKHELTDKQKLAAANRRKKNSINRIMSKYNISKKDATKTYNERSGHRTTIIKET